MYLIIISKRFDNIIIGVCLGITIKDIAKIAGVSTSTVSLVLSGKGYVSDQTKSKVQSIIDEYNYRPLRSARQLASNKTGNIGFIISDVHLSRSEAFYTRILLGAELEARNYDAYILLSSVGSISEKKQIIPRFLNAREIDGVIVAGSVHVDLIKHIMKENIPVVLIDYDVMGMKLNTILMDNHLGIKQIVSHLVAQKMTKIGFIGGSSTHPSIKERFSGYQIAMEFYGLEKIARNTQYHYIVEKETSTEIGSDGVEAVLTNVKDLEAVICVNDTTAIGCLKKLDEMNKKVPNDIAVVGFDDINYSAIAQPPITTVHVPKIEMGVEGVKRLMELIENPNQLYQKRLIPVELVERISSIK